MVYKGFYLGKQITSDTLRYLNEFDLQQLIPESNFGLRVLLRRQIKNWKATEVSICLYKPSLVFECTLLKF